MNTLWVAFLTAMAVIALVEILGAFLPPILTTTPTSVRLRRERTEKELDFNHLRQEVQEMVMSRNMLINDRTELESKLAQLEHRQRLLDLDRPLLVIELGEPRGDNKIFRAGVSNRFVVANRIPPGMFDTPLNTMWARENAVEIWAQDVNEARALLETTYPKGKGFEIVFFGDQVEAAA